ncbi:MAG: hypothetical protein AAF349_27325, partial [Cyanobacteria bacterium P01_A01_bin.68]
MKSLKLPKSSNSSQSSDVIEAESSILILGANGSGKTRLGTWIEFNSVEKDKVHRISAQKSLSMPESISPISMKKAESLLYYGHYHEQKSDHNNSRFKLNSRWGQNPETFLLNDGAATDADMLARLTRVPGSVWVALFGLV